MGNYAYLHLPCELDHHVVQAIVAATVRRDLLAPSVLDASTPYPDSWVTVPLFNLGVDHGLEVSGYAWKGGPKFWPCFVGDEGVPEHVISVKMTDRSEPWAQAVLAAFSYAAKRFGGVVTWESRVVADHRGDAPGVPRNEHGYIQSVSRWAKDCLGIIDDIAREAERLGAEWSYHTPAVPA